MINNIFMGSILDALVPISRFNKGEANKILDEVQTGLYMGLFSHSLRIGMKLGKPINRYVDVVGFVRHLS